MKPVVFEFREGNERLTSHSVLALIGALMERTASFYLRQFDYGWTYPLTSKNSPPILPSIESNTLVRLAKIQLVSRR
jgi:hypothetical protein